MDSSKYRQSMSVWASAFLGRRTGYEVTYDLGDYERQSFDDYPASIRLKGSDLGSEITLHLDLEAVLKLHATLTDLASDLTRHLDERPPPPPVPALVAPVDGEAA